MFENFSDLENSINEMQNFINLVRWGILIILIISLLNTLLIFKNYQKINKIVSKKIKKDK